MREYKVLAKYLTSSTLEDLLEQWQIEGVDTRREQEQILKAIKLTCPEYEL